MIFFKKKKPASENEEIVNKVRKKMKWHGEPIRIRKIVPKSNPNWENEWEEKTENQSDLFIPKFGKSQTVQIMGQYIMSREPEEFEFEADGRIFHDDSKVSKKRFQQMRLSIFEYGGYMAEWRPEIVFVLRYVINEMKKLPEYKEKHPELWMIEILRNDTWK